MCVEQRVVFKEGGRTAHERVIVIVELMHTLLAELLGEVLAFRECGGDGAIRQPQRPRMELLKLRKIR